MAVDILKDNSISIGFGEGIGQSVLSPFSDMLGVNIDDNPGSISTNFKFQKIEEEITPTTFTVTTDRVVTTDPIIYRGNTDYIAVTLTTTGTLPTGLSTGTIYYTEKTGTNTYKLKTTIKGSGYVSITAGTGSGTHTINPITPKSIRNGCWTTNSQGRIFAIDTDNRVWFANDVSDPWYLVSGNTSTGSGNGIIFYKGYILIIGNTKIDALTDIQSITTDTIVWNNDIVTGTINTSASADDNTCVFLSTNDDALYFINGTVAGRYHRIALLEEKAMTIFDPTDSDTFSFVADVVTIPFEDYVGATVIKEIGEYLIIGTGNEKVYLWDKKSPSFTSFISLQEKYTSDIQIVDNTAYIFAGRTGSVYIANTASSKLLITIPQHFTNEYYSIYDINVYSSIVHQRELLFSVSFSNSDNTVNNYLMSFNLDKGTLTKKNVSSFGETGDRNGTFFGKIHSIFGNGKNIYLSSSSYSNSLSKYSYAIESLLYVSSTESGTPSYYSYDNYESNIVTGLFSYGDFYAKKTTRELFVSFLRPLATGQGIRVYYRRDDNSAWTLLKTIDYATYGAIKELKETAPITDIIDLQIKIELDGLNLTSPRLKTLRLIP